MRRAFLRTVRRSCTLEIHSCDARELAVSASRHSQKLPSLCASIASSTLSTQPSWGSLRTCLETFANSASMPVFSEQPLTPTSRTWQSISMGEALEDAESFQQQAHERPHVILEQLAKIAHTNAIRRRLVPNVWGLAQQHLALREELVCQLLVPYYTPLAFERNFSPPRPKLRWLRWFCASSKSTRNSRRQQRRRDRSSGN